MYLNTLAKLITGRLLPSHRLRRIGRNVIRLLGIPEERPATLSTANSETREWLIEQSAEAAAPAPAKSFLVSIVMAAWNRGDIIERAIKSVLEQNYQNWELIIVDDGSTDDTRERVKRYALESRIRYVYRDHRNASAARNAGLMIAEGEIIAYLDTDVVWFPGYLTNIVSAFAEDEELGAVYTAQLVEDKERLLSYVRCEEFDYIKLCRENYIDLNVFSHRRSIYEREGGFDENLNRLVDWDLIRRFTEYSKIRRLPAVGGIYTFDRPDQVTKTRSVHRNQYLIETKKKHRDRQPMKVLYTVWHYPQLSESYVRTEIRGVRKLGVEVEVWSEADVAAPFESEVPVHRGSLSDVIAGFKPDLIHTHWLHMADKFSSDL
ncbi:MAG: glycosyltransferase family 2 protein, partial [Acidobacteria bacterium]|nr:glycosyltransferase family 2 protein [Acidobacteriota bacterium]